MSGTPELFDAIERVGIEPDLPVITAKPVVEEPAAPAEAQSTSPASPIGFRYSIRKGRFFWQGTWARGNAIGVTNGHIYRSFSRSRIIAKMERIKARQERRARPWQRIY